MGQNFVPDLNLQVMGHTKQQHHGAEYYFEIENLRLPCAAA